MYWLEHSAYKSSAERDVPETKQRIRDWRSNSQVRGQVQDRLWIDLWRPCLIPCYRAFLVRSVSHVTNLAGIEPLHAFSASITASYRGSPLESTSIHHSWPKWVHRQVASKDNRGNCHKCPNQREEKGEHKVATFLDSGRPNEWRWHTWP